MSAAPSRASGRRVALVTGAGGFIGRRTLQPLRDAGFTLHTTGRGAIGPWAVRHHRCDLLDARAVADLVAAVRPTHVLHLAWDVSPGQYWHAPANAKWADASVALARACAAHGVARFVGVGSCAEYDADHAPGRPRREADPIRPATAYGAAKARAFDALSALFAQAGVSFAWARLFSLHGEGEYAERLHPSVLRALVRGEPIVLTAGHRVRDYLEVGEAGRVLAHLLDDPCEGPINVASGEPQRIADIARGLARARGLEHLVIDASPAGASPDVLIADVDRLRACRQRWARGLPMPDPLEA
jgi:nucleoside-diphosphate-sugar epimerase